jgi:hypothetical protein
MPTSRHLTPSSTDGTDPADRDSFAKQAHPSRRGVSRLAAHEGERVALSLADGSTIDGCALVSVGRSGAGTIWVVTDENDVFIPLAELIELWPTMSSENAPAT